MLLFFLIDRFMPLLLIIAAYFGIRSVIFRLRRPNARQSPQFTSTARNRVPRDDANTFESHFSDEE